MLENQGLYWTKSILCCMGFQIALRRIRDQFARHLGDGFLPRAGSTIGDGMRQDLVEFRKAVLRIMAVPGVALLLGVGGAIAQSGDLRAQDQSAKPAQQQQQNANPASAAEAAARENKRRTDEFAEAAKAINGPAGNPECVWLGRRVVVLMWRDDLDTAFRHLDLYDRFGCPGGHLQATFRCLVRFGGIDPKVPDSLNSRVHACWVNPSAQPETAAANPPASGAPAPSGGQQPAAATPQPQQPATPPAQGK
jgi:hypothetical protein